ncbi:MAG: LptF/LptG family permease [Paludibacteraceae bacterium]|nr:LptF/LptG family permease [Paludibacteraceae bacterium]
MIKKIDWYIIKKFLGTFFFSIVLILSIAIVFDLTENMDDFFDNQVPAKEIVFDYYFNFVPYYLNMFAPLFIFISVIFFTSKMAGNSEIIAMLATGMSFERIMRPYWISATLLAIMIFWLGGYVIPPANTELLDFKDRYIDHFKSDHARKVQMEVDKGTVLFIDVYQRNSNTGYRASLDHFEGKALTMRLTADRIRYDSAYNWYFENYVLREFDGMYETVRSGQRFDTIIPVQPHELFITAEMAEQMTNTELKAYLDVQRDRGVGNIQAFETEWHKRFASPIAAFIMTLMAVTLSARKVRGGMGKNLGIGIALSAIYILFSTISTTFAVSGVMSSFMAVWLPNFVFLGISLYLYTKAPR